MSSTSRKYRVEREKFRDLFRESLRQGVSLDTQFNEGNTLMHFAVSLDMYTEVAFLLDAGANYLIANAGGHSPRDIALESGNQAILYLFQREAYYQCHRASGSRSPRARTDTCFDYLMLDENTTSPSPNVLVEKNQLAMNRALIEEALNTDDNVVFWLYGGTTVCKHEDYCDWSEAQMITFAEELLDRLSADEQRFEILLNTLDAERQRNFEELSQLYSTLKNDEQAIYKKLLTINKCVIRYQGKINNLTNLKMEIKKEIATTKRRILFSGRGQLRFHNGIIFKFYKQTRVIVTGEYLILCDPDQDFEKAIEAAGTAKERSCLAYAQYIRVCDIVKVQVERTGFDSDNPTVKFLITVLVRDQRTNTSAAPAPSGGALETSVPSADRTASRTRSSVALDAAALTSTDSLVVATSKATAKVKSKEMAIFLPADVKSSKSIFPQVPSTITPDYFCGINPASDEASYAHRFMLALLAASKDMECKGDYLPPGILSDASKLDGFTSAPNGSDKNRNTPQRKRPMARLFGRWGNGSSKETKKLEESESNKPLATDNRASLSSNNSAGSGSQYGVSDTRPTAPSQVVMEGEDASEMDISAFSMGYFNEDESLDALFPVCHVNGMAGDNGQSDIDAIQAAHAEIADDTLNLSTDSPTGLKSHVVNSGIEGFPRHSLRSSYASAVLGGDAGPRLQTVIESEERTPSSDSEYVSHGDICTPDVNALVAVTQQSISGTRRYGRRWISPVSVARENQALSSPSMREEDHVRALLSPISAVSLRNGEISPYAPASDAIVDDSSPIADAHQLDETPSTSSRPPIDRRRTVDGSPKGLSDSRHRDNIPPIIGHHQSEADLVDSEEAGNPSSAQVATNGASNGPGSLQGVVKEEGIAFKNLMEVQTELSRVRDQTTLAEHRLHKYLSLREFEHQLFTYLVAMREVAGGPEGLYWRNNGTGIAANDDLSPNKPNSTISLSPSAPKTPINSAHKAAAVLEQLVSSNLLTKVPSFVDDDIRDDYRNSEVTDSDDAGAKLEVSNIRDIDSHIGLDIDEEMLGEILIGQNSDPADAVDKTAALLTAMEGTSELISNLVESKLPPSMRASSRRAPGNLRGASKGSNSFSTSQSRTSSFSSEDLDNVDDPGSNMRNSELNRFTLSPFASTSNADTVDFAEFDRLSISIGFGTSPVYSNRNVQRSKESPKSPLPRSQPQHQSQSHLDNRPPTTVLSMLPMGHPPKQLIERYHRLFDILRNLYSIERASFDARERLKEIAVVKHEASVRYWQLQKASHAITAPPSHDLYEIEL